MVRRKDSKGRVLKDGETERKSGGYQYRWTTLNGERKYIYAKTLAELREKEAEIEKIAVNGLTYVKSTTLNEVYDMWKNIKRGLKENTFCNYKYMYEQFVRDTFGKRNICSIKKSDVRQFYNYLMDERGLKSSTLDCIQNVLHQVFELAVDDNYIAGNPCTNALKEIKRIKNISMDKRRALTKDEQDVFINYLKKSKYNHWYPIFGLMCETGLRVGEITGLRWEDIDFDNKTLSVNHNLIYYSHSDKKCGFGISTPKTKSSIRTIPLTDKAIDALLAEKYNHELKGISSLAVVEGYRNFIFVNRFGNVQHQGTLNKAIKRIVRDYNLSVMDKRNPVLLPSFSCHSLRHTFATRLCEAGINVKVIQGILGHADAETTLNIYIDVTKDMIDGSRDVLNSI